MSARFVPDDERWNCGWFGRDGAREARDPEIERPWLAVTGALYIPLMELERFMAEAGCGMLEL
jgi:hypothetical protein